MQANILDRQPFNDQTVALENLLSNRGELILGNDILRGGGIYATDGLAEVISLSFF